MAEVTLEFIARLIQRGFAEVRDDIRMLRSAINDLHHESTSSGEIAALHHDVNRVMEQQHELAARMDVLERAGEH